LNRPHPGRRRRLSRLPALKSWIGLSAGAGFDENFIGAKKAGGYHQRLCIPTATSDFAQQSPESFDIALENFISAFGVAIPDEPRPPAAAFVFCIHVDEAAVRVETHAVNPGDACPCERRNDPRQMFGASDGDMTGCLRAERPWTIARSDFQRAGGTLGERQVTVES
jgi:hypothetical protein